MIKAIIFDCFGVLIGTGFKDTYARAGGDPEKDKLFIDNLLDSANRGRVTSLEMSQRISEKLQIPFDEWRKVVANSEMPNQSLLEYIEQTRKKYKTAILSNANIGTMERKFTAKQLNLFNAVVVSAEVGMIKPELEIYLYTAKMLAVEPQECLFIDDNQTYCDGANKVGMKTICYRSLLQFKHDCGLLLSH